MIQNPFEILDVRPEPILDLVELRKKYIEIQRNGHPDLGNSPEISEAANRAYTVLKSDETRLEAILKLSGIWPPDTQLIGMEFLMQAMELGETIDGLNPDDSQSRETVLAELNQMSEDLKLELQALHNIYAENANWQENTAYLHRLSACYQKRRYLTRLEKNLNQESEL